MVPVIIHLRFRKPGRRPFGIYFPILLVWILLAALLIVLFPFLLLAALLTWRRGPGPALLVLYPLLAGILWNMSGLHVEARNAETDLLIDFT
jgi:hypothetical protein